MHWLILYCSQKSLFFLGTLRYQFLHPLVYPVQDVKQLSQSARSKEACLKGIRLVSKFIISVGSTSPIGPRKTSRGLSTTGIVRLDLSSWKLSRRNLDFKRSKAATLKKNKSKRIEKYRGNWRKICLRRRKRRMRSSSGAWGHHESARTLELRVRRPEAWTIEATKFGGKRVEAVLFMVPLIFV
jgi:hypothetical protein